MIRTAPEGRWFIVGAWIIALALAWIAFRTGAVGWWVAAALWTVLAVWVVAFFRDPERSWAQGERLVVSPADGEVVSLLEVDEPAFLGGRAIRISIFMNVFDCHVNRYPMDGTVAFRHYNPGHFGHAGAEKASLSMSTVALPIAEVHQRAAQCRVRLGVLVQADAGHSRLPALSHAGHAGIDAVRVTDDSAAGQVHQVNAAEGTVQIRRKTCPLA